MLLMGMQQNREVARDGVLMSHLDLHVQLYLMTGSIYELFKISEPKLFIFLLKPVKVIFLSF